MSTPVKKSKLKAERREEEKQKARKKKQHGGTLSGQIQKIKSAKFYKKFKK